MFSSFPNQFKGLCFHEESYVIFKKIKTVRFN